MRFLITIVLFCSSFVAHAIPKDKGCGNQLDPQDEETSVPKPGPKTKKVRVLIAIKKGTDLKEAKRRLYRFGFKVKRVFPQTEVIEGEWDYDLENLSLWKNAFSPSISHSAFHGISPRRLRIRPRKA